jgi:hypothetical protein
VSLAFVGENSCNNPKFRRRRRNAEGTTPKGDEKLENCEREVEGRLIARPSLVYHRHKIHDGSSGCSHFALANKID